MILVFVEKKWCGVSGRSLCDTQRRNTCTKSDECSALEAGKVVAYIRFAASDEREAGDNLADGIDDLLDKVVLVAA